MQPITTSSSSEISKAFTLALTFFGVSARGQSVSPAPASLAVMRAFPGESDCPLTCRVGNTLRPAEFPLRKSTHAQKVPQFALALHFPSKRAHSQPVSEP